MTLQNYSHGGLILKLLDSVCVSEDAGKEAFRASRRDRICLTIHGLKLYHGTLWYDTYCMILQHWTEFTENVKTIINRLLCTIWVVWIHHIILIIQQTNWVKTINSKCPFWFIWKVSANYQTHWCSGHNIKMRNEI